MQPNTYNKIFIWKMQYLLIITTYEMMAMTKNY